MSIPKLPTPYELAQIAAILRGQDAGKKPTEAAKQALALWFSVKNVLQEAKEELKETKRSEYKKRSAANTAKVKHFEIGNRNHSAAMDWVNHQVHGEGRDSFKSFRAFLQAFWVFEPWSRRSRPPHSVDEHTLKRFLEWRTEERRKADTDGKRKRRRLIVPSNTPSNINSKIAAGRLPESVRSKQ